MKEAFVGFDSAWAGRTHGAIAYAVFQDKTLEEEGLPQLSDFSDAANIIKKLQKDCVDVLVAIDRRSLFPMSRARGRWTP